MNPNVPKATRRKPRATPSKLVKAWDDAGMPPVPATLDGVAQEYRALISKIEDAKETLASLQNEAEIKRRVFSDMAGQTFGVGLVTSQCPAAPACPTPSPIAAPSYSPAPASIDTAAITALLDMSAGMGGVTIEFRSGVFQVTRRAKCQPDKAGTGYTLYEAIGNVKK